MNVVVAMDSFKGSLTSMEAGDAVRRGIGTALPDAQVTVCPLADGGEGTVDALTDGLGGRRETVTVTGPLGESVAAVYGILPDGAAVMEMAAAAGLPLAPPDRRNPLYTTTRGVGEMIRHALETGSRRILLGIGGSATNDGGAGMLQALGFALTDDTGAPIPEGAIGLARLARISGENALPALQNCVITVACDVNNPLCGPRGASAVYGPQKGASPEAVRQLDSLLARFAAVAAREGFACDPDAPGAGAAGGLGFGLTTFLGASLRSGSELVMELTRLEDHIRQADIVITGEGRLDRQTAMGKGPGAVAALARRYGKPVIALAGCLSPDAGDGQEAFDACFPILPAPATAAEAMERDTARQNLQHTAHQVFRLLSLR